MQLTQDAAALEQTKLMLLEARAPNVGEFGPPPGLRIPPDHEQPFDIDKVIAKRIEARKAQEELFDPTFDANDCFASLFE